MKYLTMICDIKNSKNIENREEVQYKLIDTLKDVNKSFSSIIVVPFIILVGDEWEGLLKFPCDYYLVVEYFHEKMPSIDFYCGVGIGDVSIKNFELTVNQLDGPSFYKARDAINIAKQNKYDFIMIQ